MNFKFIIQYGSLTAGKKFIFTYKKYQVNILVTKS